MSWIQKLHDTYERCAGAPQFASNPLLPIGHTIQQAHIEITLDDRGKLLHAVVVPKEETVIPATEKSAGRVGIEPPPHPLCDKIQYCAADYPAHGGKKKSFHSAYIEQLKLWCNSNFSHPKAKAVLAYVSKGTVVADLVQEKILHVGNDGVFLTSWDSNLPTPEIFRYLTPKGGERDQGDAFVRWRVQTPGNPLTATWEDKSLMDAWIAFDASQNQTKGLCMVTGKAMLLAKSHPKRLRHGADGAKLISSNDTSGYTFLGRFTDAEQACGIGYEVTQMAHNALRWLIGRRQTFRNGDQVIVAWAVAGKSIPDPFSNTRDIFDLESDQSVEELVVTPGDVGQAFARRLSRCISGYQAELGSTDDIVVMGLDSATPGRMAITYYRELTGFEFLDRVRSWHEKFAWHQNYSKEIKFIGSPSPKDIAEAAFGRRLDDNLRKATVERLLPCIIDGQPLPRDLMESTVRRASNRVGLEHWEWEKNLGIACALFRGYFRERSYSMTLEKNRTTRDYLYGRLLAVADHLEYSALSKEEKNRETSAARLMQRFAEQPFSTWRNIEVALTPYRSRLKSRNPGLLLRLDKQLDDIMIAFGSDDFSRKGRLSGEFLLGFHCERKSLWEKRTKLDETDETQIVE